MLIGEVLLRLLSLGYRPATVDEIAAVQSQVGDGIPYLGEVAGYGPGFALGGYGGTYVTSSKCPGYFCSLEEATVLYPGDKIAAVKL